ncbi:protein FAM228A [Tenrec ecaudatus]|uniref:protein FAM228A n=1 Tax=Tenrec ecaudatus TaxID=94439 RepID=UPI003F5A2352
MPNYGDHFKAEKVNEWPDPKAVYLMEAFAREDVDRAVHLLLLREDYVVKEFIPALCDPLIWRQHGAENRATQCDTGKRSSLKEFKDTQTARLPANLPHFTCTLHRVIPKDRRRTSARSKRSQGYRPCRPEMITCTETKELFEKVEKTTDPSQRAFEKQFIISRLNQETKRDKRKELVSRGLQGAGAGAPPRQPH